jgi:translocation and assembly module TamA
VLGTNEQSAIARLRFNNWGLRDRALLFLLEAGRRDFAAFEGYTAAAARPGHAGVDPDLAEAAGPTHTAAELLATNESQVGAAEISLGSAYFIGGLDRAAGLSTAPTACSTPPGASASPHASTRKPRCATALPFTCAPSSTAASITQSRRILPWPAGCGWDRSTASSAIGSPRRGAFYAGGGGSVRGFGFQGWARASPSPTRNFDPAEDDPEEVPTTLSLPVGGRSLTEFAVEGPLPFGNYGVVAFVDAGSVSDAGISDLRRLPRGRRRRRALYTNSARSGSTSPRRSAGAKASR